MTNNRLHQIEDHLNLLREQQASLEREALLTTGLPKTQAEQRLRLEIKPKIRDYEQEYWQILAENANQLNIPEPKAEVIVAELVESVGRLEVQQDYSAEMMQVLLELRDKLNQPQAPAAIKVKWALSAIPPFVSLATEGELDIEKFLQTNFPTFRNWSKVLAKKL
ncbi:MAG: hypothetical protein DCF22_16080 [Leptolyngbya sp.]|nr:MAG: hypothetical protein DCF22_16080 [Leptolyngbya sp.]